MRLILPAFHCPLSPFPFVLKAPLKVIRTMSLSIPGISLIILTYAAFHDLRTITRQLLVKLSVADIVIASSHFVGVLTNYKRFVYSKLRTNVWCSVQGAVTMYRMIFGSLLFIPYGTEYNVHVRVFLLSAPYIMQMLDHAFTEERENGSQNPSFADQKSERAQKRSKLVNMLI